MIKGLVTNLSRPTNRATPPISFLPSSTQPAQVGTITVKKIDGTLTIILVNTIEVSNSHLTQGASNVCTLSLGAAQSPGMKSFLSGGFA